MGLDETVVSRWILKKFMEDFLDSLDIDVSIIGAGPAGLAASMFIARAGKKVAIFEKHPYCGGGLLSGGMLLPRGIVTNRAKPLLEEIGVFLTEAERNCYTINSIELASKLSSKAVDSGVRIWNNTMVEDVIFRKGKIEGVVVNWAAVKIAKLHVDPLAIRSRIVIDATGHDAEIAQIVKEKVPHAKFPTKTGGIIGEKSMWAVVGETEILNNTQEIYPGFIVAGMAANTVFGSPRMGAVFDGMLLSGKKAADVALGVLRKKRA